MNPVKRFSALVPVVLVLLGGSVMSQENAANTIGQRLKGYSFERKKVVNATRNILLDYLQAGRTDSIRMAISFCDSITAPDSSWLSAKERLFVHFICGDTQALRDLDYFCSRFNLYDTAKPMDFKLGCRTEDGDLSSYYESSQDRDNLTAVLFKECKKALPDNRKKFSESADIWDFWEMAVLEPCVSGKTLKDGLDSFRGKHPDSPFSRLKAIDWAKMHARNTAIQQVPQIRSGTGGGFLGGPSYIPWHTSDSAVYPDNLGGVLSLDLVFENIQYQINMRLSSVKTKGDIILSDTLKKGSDVSISNISFCVGPIFSLSAKDYLCPSAGAELVLNIIRSNDTLPFNLPFVVAGRLGIDYTRLMGRFGESYVGPAVRLSAGMIAGDFRRISGTLRRAQFYFNITLGLFGFGSRGGTDSFDYF